MINPKISWCTTCSKEDKQRGLFVSGLAMITKFYMKKVYKEK